jgi:hypothetical protein
MPTLNEKFPPPNGTDHVAVTGLLTVSGLSILVALLISLYGLGRRLRPQS